MTHPLTPEMLPCPFCGGPVKLERCADTYEREHGNRQWWGVVCRNTISLGGTCAIHQSPSASEEAAIKRWNTRSLKSPRAEREGALEEAARVADMQEVHAKICAAGGLRGAKESADTAKTIALAIRALALRAPTLPTAKGEIAELVGELDALEKKATPGPYRFVGGDTIVSNQSHPIWKLSDAFHRKLYGGETGQDGEFLVALLNAWPKLRSALTAGSPAPESVSVPVEPTSEMIQAMEDRMVEGAAYIAENSIQYALWREVYQAMLLAARPQPERREG